MGEHGTAYGRFLRALDSGNEVVILSAARSAKPLKVRELQRTLYRAAKADPGRRFHALYDKDDCSHAIANFEFARSIPRLPKRSRS